MAQFVDKPQYSHLHRVIDFVDVDSDKWRQYAENHGGIMRWVYQREHRLLQKVERQYCEHFDRSLFVSPDEAELFRTLMPHDLSPKIQPLLNGVDVRFFDPSLPLSAAEFELNKPYIVFTGAMDYWANVDAVCWFVEHVWPGILQQHPTLHFMIVGGNPSSEVKELAKNQGIVVTGRVEDVRPYIHNALLVVAPLRIARGIQNKVLEAMAMNKIVIATAMAMEGINAPESAWLKQTDAAAEFTTHVLESLSSPSSNIAARQWIIDHFTWSATLEPLKQWMRRT
jgi:sugar transferase (PEP-CTERM/EpsH1 system associated)